MWLRDTQCEPFEGTSWVAFDDLLNNAALPDIPLLQYPAHDLELWCKLVKKLPSSKAVGPCGWSNGELKAIPLCCIRDLVVI